MTTKMPTPDFSRFKKTAFKSVKTNKAYSLVKASDFDPTPEVLGRLVTLCNERVIYDVLFRRMCDGKPYAVENAVSFLNRARKGWVENTHFVFIICDGKGQQVAAIDIKSADVNRGEVGYWASADHPGVVTPATAELCKAAKDAGFKTLFAYVALTNSRSTRVLEYNGFAQEPGIVFHNNKNCFVYSKIL